MPAKDLSPAAKAFAAAVVVAGFAAFADLWLRVDPLRGSLVPLAVFGPLAVTAVAAVTVYRGSLPSAMSFQMGTAFVFALFLVSGSAEAALAVGVMAAVDWAASRRQPMVGGFNVGQLLLSCWIGAAVRSAIAAPGPMDAGSTRSLLGGIAGVAAFSACNHLLTHVVVRLASRRPLLDVPGGSADGLLSEALCVTSGITMALLWSASPGLAVFGAAPLLVHARVLDALASRQEALDRRDAELRSLQELGIEIGSELERGPLYASIVRIAAQALESSGALLAVLDPEGRRLEIVAWHGLPARPPEFVDVSRFADGFFETGRLRRIEDLASERNLYPELRFLASRRVTGALAAPLRTGGRLGALLLVVHGPSRRVFDEDDERRLATLLRFVEPALTNLERSRAAPTSP